MVGGKDGMDVLGGDLLAEGQPGEQKGAELESLLSGATATRSKLFS